MIKDRKAKRELRGMKGISSIPTPHGMALAQQSDFEHMGKLIETNPWKAFVLIHATLEFQLRLALWVDDRERIERKTFAARWPLILGLRSFRKLADICFIVGIINKELRDKLLEFNADRNKIVGHVDPDLRRRDISDEAIVGTCQRGLRLVKESLDAIHEILFKDKKPKHE